MKKWLKWLLVLALVVVALAVVFFLSLDSILRTVMVQRLRTQTGMDVQMGRFHLGLREPVMTIQDLRLYNSSEFGCAPFLSVPEIHVEYDREALTQKQLHFKLVRFNLGELDIVRNAAGQTNLLALGLKRPSRETPAEEETRELADFQRQTGLAFTGIDVLQVSVGTARFIDLQDPRNNREQAIGIENLEMKNVHSFADLAGLAVLVALRGGDFFTMPLPEPSAK